MIQPMVWRRLLFPSIWSMVIVMATVLPTVAAPRPITVDDLLAVQRVAEPHISPDGQSVVYTVSIPDVEANSVQTNLWLAPTDGGPPRQLTNTAKKDRHPRFSPSGRQILFESNRSGSNQLWVIDIDGGEARQLTTLATEASTGVWSPDGKWIAFVSAVFPEFSHKPFEESDRANKERLDALEKRTVKARVHTRLFFRHWDSWVDDKRQHLFVMPTTGGPPRDVTPGDRDAYPTSTTFSVGDDFTFSPDSRSLVFTAVPAKDEAWNTNHDIYRVPITGGEWENLTADNLAADSAPRFSPDGKWLAYRVQRRPGFEADRWELVVTPAAGGKPRSLTEKLDRSVDDMIWSADSKGLWFLAEEEARTPVYCVSLEGKAEPRLRGATHAALSGAGSGELAIVESSLTAPPAVVVYDRQGKQRCRLDPNQNWKQALDLPAAESVSVPGAGGTPMQMWLLKPPGFDANRKWPLVYLVHGGPQGAWGDSWSYRWNPQVWAAQGYVVAMPNPRGSTGFGQKYVDEISGDWGGKCYDDLMAGLAHLERQPYIDRQRLAAAGASFGGYMMNWFGVQTDKFKTLITHCGVFNFDTMYTTTDELWFDEWEHGGPPWGQRDSYEKHSPHRFAQNLKTPMLIIHNDLDFRVPMSEGYQLFTTLQRRGVPSKLINFPDEGHWVLKPANSRFWHQEIFEWLEEYCPPGGE